MCLWRGDLAIWAPTTAFPPRHEHYAAEFSGYAIGLARKSDRLVKLCWAWRPDLS
ncbi:hypothetical protein SAMN05428953_12165 [Mesorhizobium muleiense]|uniref:Uncharacterized protein n=1 Tax=Mesorhizobium muleiense TaxID=1004279 RepID=A0A1G9F3I1_9HYPH|nr:hypothetical protein SAMN05428953_12165 [Mesorhizobium muleiense]